MTMKSMVKLDSNFASAEPTVSQQQVEERQKDVIAGIRNIVMGHVICTSEAETGRQPSVHMNPPVDFFGRDQVDSPANEDARSHPEA
jgi:hypothetical protein